MPKKYSGLPEGIVKDASKFLTVKDKFAMGLTERTYQGFFHQKASVEKLLELVVQGEQDKAEKILRKYPELLIQKGNVTDLSGRIFHDVSPWQCMLWTLDTRYMGQMMLSCIPEGEAGETIRQELINQYDKMKEGVHYTYKGIEHCDSCYDFGIIDTLQDFVDKQVDLTFPEQDALWISSVGQKQREMPAHVMQHYCDPEMKFTETTDFKASRLVRSFQFRDLAAETESTLLFEGTYNPGLGSQFGLIRSSDSFMPFGDHTEISAMLVEDDISALRRLCDVRQSDRQQLRTQLGASPILEPEAPMGKP